MVAPRLPRWQQGFLGDPDIPQARVVFRGPRELFSTQNRHGGTKMADQTVFLKACPPPPPPAAAGAAAPPP